MHIPQAPHVCDSVYAGNAKLKYIFHWYNYMIDISECIKDKLKNAEELEKTFLKNEQAMLETMIIIS